MPTPRRAPTGSTAVSGGRRRTSPSPGTATSPSRPPDDRLHVVGPRDGHRPARPRPRRDRPAPGGPAAPPAPVRRRTGTRRDPRRPGARLAPAPGPLPPALAGAL